MSISILDAARDLVITHEEVQDMMVDVFTSAIVGGMLVYLVLMFGKGIGLEKEKRAQFVEAVRGI